jgi:predicted metalloprotease with PDZ domain
MNKLNFAAILAAGAALALSPAHVAAQAEAKPVSMGIRLKPHAEGGEVAVLLPGLTGAAVGFEVGDILIEAGGTPVSPKVLQEYMKTVRAGDQVSFKVKRAGAVVELTGKGVAAPEGASAPMAQPQE